MGDNCDFINKSKKELELFYAPFFHSGEELQYFLRDVFDYENGSLTKRQMVFQVQRFISLANDIDQIRPARDSLRVMFLKFGLDSLCSLSGYMNKTKQAFYDEFCTCFTEEGKNYILENFKLSSFQDEYKGHSFESGHEIDLGDFLNIIKVVRDKVAHDFNYWGIQFFAHDSDSIWLSEIETEENLLQSYKYQRKSKILTTYHFTTTLNYEKFIYYFTEACVGFIKKKTSNIA